MTIKIRKQVQEVQPVVKPEVVKPGLSDEMRDDLAVDDFAYAMKAKLAWEREERGRSGWHDPAQCTEYYLARLLVEHIDKGNAGTFEDIANFCMMLHQRGADPKILKAQFENMMHRRFGS